MGFVRVKWATICRYAENGNSGPILIGAGVDVLFKGPPQIPHVVYVAGCLFDAHDTPKTEWLKVTVFKPNGDVLYSRDHSAFYERRIGVEHVPASSEEYFHFAQPVEILATERGMYGIGVQGSHDTEPYMLYLSVIPRPPDAQIEIPQT